MGETTKRGEVRLELISHKLVAVTDQTEQSQHKRRTRLEVHNNRCFVLCDGEL